jgi:hypothetical protein
MTAQGKPLVVSIAFDDFVLQDVLDVIKMPNKTSSGSSSSSATNSTDVVAINELMLLGLKRNSSSLTMKASVNATWSVGIQVLLRNAWNWSRLRDYAAVRPCTLSTGEPQARALCMLLLLPFVSCLQVRGDLPSLSVDFGNVRPYGKPTEKETQVAVLSMPAFDIPDVRRPAATRSSHLAWQFFFVTSLVVPITRAGLHSHARTCAGHVDQAAPVGVGVQPDAAARHDHRARAVQSHRLGHAAACRRHR